MEIMSVYRLEKISTCYLCNKNIGSSGVSIFTLLNIKRYNLKVGPFIGENKSTFYDYFACHNVINPYYGRHLETGTPSEEIATVEKEVEITVCENCFNDNPLLSKILGIINKT